MIRIINKFLAPTNFILAILTLIAAIIEWKLSYISDDVFFRFTIIALLCLAIAIAVKKLKVFNRPVSHIIVFLITIAIFISVCRQIFVINGFVIAVPPNFKGQVYIKLNDENSNKRVRPFNGVVVFPINSKGQLFTKSNFDVSESAIFSMELKNGSLINNDNSKITNLKITKQVLNGNPMVIITGSIGSVSK